MPLIAKHFFWPQLIHHFGCSKVAAYSEANSCSEEFTSDIAKWLFLSVGLLARHIFCAVCIFDTLQPLDSSANRWRQTFTQARAIYMLPFHLWKKYTWLKFSPSFLYCICVSNSTLGPHEPLLATIKMRNLAWFEHITIMTASPLPILLSALDGCCRLELIIKGQLPMYIYISKELDSHVHSRTTQYRQSRAISAALSPCIPNDMDGLRTDNDGMCIVQRQGLLFQDRTMTWNTGSA